MFTAVLFILTSGLAICGAQASAKEMPLWEGVSKTLTMLKADRDFVAGASRQTNGDLAIAARRGIELGWQAFGNNDPDLAIRRFNQAWLLDPENAAIYWGFALATHARGDDLDVVERWFAEAERRIPEAVPLFSDHGRVLEERGHAQRAISYFRRALALDPKHVEAHIGMVRASVAIGDRTTAAAHIAALDQIKRARP